MLECFLCALFWSWMFWNPILSIFEHVSCISAVWCGPKEPGLAPQASQRPNRCIYSGGTPGSPRHGVLGMRAAAEPWGKDGLGTCDSGSGAFLLNKSLFA